MKNKILFWFLFALGNFLLLQLHFHLFRSPAPFAGWATAVLHVAGLLLIPYSRLNIR